MPLLGFALKERLAAESGKETEAEFNMTEKITLRWDGDTGDGKSAFVVADQNDGWEDLRITVDTDDCDSDFARAAMHYVIDTVNAA